MCNWQTCPISYLGTRKAVVLRQRAMMAFEFTVDANSFPPRTRTLLSDVILQELIPRKGGRLTTSSRPVLESSQQYPPRRRASIRDPAQLSVSNLPYSILAVHSEGYGRAAAVQPYRLAPTA